MFQFKEISPHLLSHERASQILYEFKQKKILVLGDVGIDRYTFGSVERISPEAPVPILCVKEEKLKLGLAANVAENIQTLGGAAYLVGVVGEDRNAHDLKELLNRSQIQSSFLISDASRRTVLKERIVGERQQMLRIDYETEGYILEKTENELLRQLETLLPKMDGLIIEDYAKGALTPRLLEKAIQLARHYHLPIGVDPNVLTEVDSYKGATFLTPNTKEAEKLAKAPIRDLESLAHAGFKILEKSQANHLMITRGKDGIALFTKNETEVLLLPTSAKEVYDVSGAGDTVISTLMLALVSHSSVQEAIALGNLAAGIEVSKFGTATVSPREILSTL